MSARTLTEKPGTCGGCKHFLRHISRNDSPAASGRCSVKPNTRWIYFQSEPACKKYYEPKEDKRGNTAEGGTEMEKVEALREMLYKHQELPVICMVDGDVVPEDNGCRWLAKVGDVRREKVWIGAEGVYCYDDKRVDEDAINDPNCVYPEMELTDERAKEVYDGLPWTECIVINIDTH